MWCFVPVTLRGTIPANHFSTLKWLHSIIPTVSTWDDTSRGTPLLVGTPRGFRDILPTEALARERITDTVRACFSEQGYLPIETPLLEDRGSLEGGGRLADSPFQLFDTDRSLLVPAALMGAVIVLGCDLVARNLLPTSLPVGVVTGLMGAPYLIGQLIRINRQGASA